MSETRWFLRALNERTRRRRSPYKLNYPDGTIEFYGNRILLTQTEYIILEVLLDRYPKEVPNGKLHIALWDEYRPGSLGPILDRLSKKLGTRFVRSCFGCSLKGMPRGRRRKNAQTAS